VAGVQVILEGLEKSKFSRLTDDAGYFSASNLAPGDYTVRMEKVGFFILREQTIQLAAGSTEFSFTLNHIQEVREKVDVVADPNRIEPTETPQSATLTSTEFFYIPFPAPTTTSKASSPCLRSCATTKRCSTSPAREPRNRNI